MTAMTKDRSGCIKIGVYYDYDHDASRRLNSRKGGDLVDLQVVLVPSQVVNANPSDSQV